MQVLNIETSTYSLVNPDVVIEVEGTEEARQRGYVTIEIENPYPDLDVQIVVRTKKNWILTVQGTFKIVVDCSVSCTSDMV